MRLAIKNVKVVSLEDGRLRVRLVKRCNTRRNRRLAWKHLFDREEDLYFQHAPHDSVRESRIRSAAWLGPRAWRWLHVGGVYFLWVSFMVTFGKRLPQSGAYALPVLVLLVALALRLWPLLVRRPAM